MIAHVKQLVLDKWVGPSCEEGRLVSPALDDVRQAVESLDAKNRTIVSLCGSDGRSSLTIGGGNGSYVVYMSVGEDEFWNLVNRDRGFGIFMLNAGGQEGDFPERQILDLAAALRAATTFFETGGRDNSLCWELQE